MGRLGLWAGAGHPGGRTRRIRRDGTQRDKDLHEVVLLEPARIRGDLLDGTSYQIWGISGRLWTSNEGEARRVGDRVHTLPHAERG